MLPSYRDWVNDVGESLSGVITLFHAPPNSVSGSHKSESEIRITTDVGRGIPLAD